MALNAKNSDFITRARQAAAKVLEALAVLDGLRLEWDSLFNSTITADDFGADAGTNAQITLALPDDWADEIMQHAMSGANARAKKAEHNYLLLRVPLAAQDKKVPPDRADSMLKHLDAYGRRNDRTKTTENR